MLHRQLMAVALIVLPTFIQTPIKAQSVQPRQAALPITQAPASAPPGILTDRLSEKDLARWKAMEQVVFALDLKQQPFHPTLYGMWQWLETSGHTIYIEVSRSDRVSTSTAGNFSIERHDPKGERHVGVIRLNLTNIDQAYVGPTAARETGFIPFEGLSKVERYAEVLRHEMAHAVDILTSPERARNVEFMIEETNELLLKSTPRRKGEFLSSDLKKRLSKRDVLLQELEHRAESMEYIVWKELMKSKPLRDKSEGMTTGR